MDGRDAIDEGGVPRYVSHISDDGQFEAVSTHLAEVSAMAGEFAEAFGEREMAEQMGLAHDIGKYSPEFQNRILNHGPKVDHSTAGAYELLQTGSWAGAYCVAGHHAGLLDGGCDVNTCEDGTLAARMKKACAHKLGDYSAFASEVSLHQVNQSHITCRPEWGIEECCFANSFATRMLFSCLVDADFLCTERFMNGGRERDALRYDPLTVLQQRFERYISGFYPPVGFVNTLRCEVLDACMEAASRRPGIFRLTVPTGGGKTFASMRFALNHALHGDNEMRRIIYAVPYTSIIEQNAEIFRRALGSENVLEHHANFDFDSGELQSDDNLGARLRLASENWDAPVVVTTNVQFFESLFAARTSRCRKLHNIARSVIILDEAQMIPVQQLDPCIRALAELVVNYGCSVVLCTATQPAFDDFFEKLGLHVDEIIPGELSERLSTELERVTYEFVGVLSDDKLAQRIAEEPRALCVVDNRAQARRLYEMLDEQGLEGLYHLSTFMYPEHRKRVLADIRERLKDPGVPCRVISTKRHLARVPAPVIASSLARRRSSSASG